MEWNKAGWFGGQLGGTGWLLIAGMLTAIRDLPTGMLVVGLFVISNVVGFVLWKARRMSCYASTQLFIGVSGICGLLAIYLLENANVWTEIQTGAQVSAYSAYWILSLVVGGLMLMFHLRFGRGDQGPEA